MACKLKGLNLREACDQSGVNYSTITHNLCRQTEMIKAMEYMFDKHGSDEAILLAEHASSSNSGAMQIAKLVRYLKTLNSLSED